MEVGGVLDEREGDALEAPDGLPERLPGAGVLDGLVDGRLGAADAHQRDQGTGIVEAPHHRDEALALTTDHLRLVHGQPVEVE